MSISSQILINTPEEAIFARKFLSPTITVAMNSSYTAIGINIYMILIYPNATQRDAIAAIFQDNTILKLLSRPSPAWNSLNSAVNTCASTHIYSWNQDLSGISCTNCQHISEYIEKTGNGRIIPEMNREIMNQDGTVSLSQRAAEVSLIMMRYKIQADSTQHQNSLNSKESSKCMFNKGRDCYLLYLSAYNDILSRLGPITFTELTSRVRSYPYLCRTDLHPAMALEGFIKTGALSSDSETAIVSIPDQIP